MPKSKYFNYEKIQKPGAFIPVNLSVMFVDMVKFTKLGDNDTFKNAVRNLQNSIMDIFGPLTWDRDSEHEPNEAIMISTGDGYAIGFEPTLVNEREILNYASELSNAMEIEGHPIRTGISHGSCFVHQDLNEKLNLCGWAIIEAERTMSFGDKGHILCSDSFAKLVNQRKIHKNLHKLEGTFKAKHNYPLSLYNYYSDEFGNDHDPEKK